MFDIHSHEFDIAISFPGEHRAYVEALVEALIKEHEIKPEKIFYDDFYKPFLAIPSSDIPLQDIYRNRSKLIVTFLCEKYQEKEWCGLEARAIRDLIKEQNNNRIMLIRMDNGEVDGFFGIDGWIDARKYDSTKMAGFIHQRLTGKLVFPVSSNSYISSKLLKSNIGLTKHKEIDLNTTRSNDFCKQGYILDNDETNLELSELLSMGKDKSKAIFFHPKVGSKIKLELSKLLNKEKCFECNYWNVLETVEKIANSNFQLVFYILDHNQEDVFTSHKKDKLFLAIDAKFGRKLKIITVKDGKAELYNEHE